MMNVKNITATGDYKKQFWNAPSPTVSRLSGNSTLSRFSYCVNAWCPISVIPSPIQTSLMESL